MYFAPPVSAQIPEPYTVATLPLASDYPRKYAWVTDLFGGGQPDYCISDGSFWKPVRQGWPQVMAVATMTLQPLVNAPTVVLTGTIGLGISMTLTLGTTRAYPGAAFRINREAGGVGTLLTNLGLGLVSGSWVDYEWTGSVWRPTATGGLL